jgi:hypothetical protein
MNRKTNNNILVPTDFSDVADNALTHAITVAKAYTTKSPCCTSWKMEFWAVCFPADSRM